MGGEPRCSHAGDRGGEGGRGEASAPRACRGEAARVGAAVRGLRDLLGARSCSAGTGGSGRLSPKWRGGSPGPRPRFPGGTAAAAGQEKLPGCGSGVIPSDCVLGTLLETGNGEGKRREIVQEEDRKVKTCFAFLLPSPQRLLHLFSSFLYLFSPNLNFASLQLVKLFFCLLSLKHKPCLAESALAGLCRDALLLAWG